MMPVKLLTPISAMVTLIVMSLCACRTEPDMPVVTTAHQLINQTQRPVVIEALTNGGQRHRQAIMPGDTFTETPYRTGGYNLLFEHQFRSGFVTHIKLKYVCTGPDSCVTFLRGDPNGRFVTQFFYEQITNYSSGVVHIPELMRHRITEADFVGYGPCP